MEANEVNGAEESPEQLPVVQEQPTQPIQEAMPPVPATGGSSLLPKKLPVGSEQRGIVVQVADAFGFIRCPAARDQFFYRKSEASEELHIGDEVSFTVEDPDPRLPQNRSPKQQSKKVTLVQRAAPSSYVLGKELLSGVVAHSCPVSTPQGEEVDGGRISYQAPGNSLRQTLVFRAEDCVNVDAPPQFGALVTFRVLRQPGSGAARATQITEKAATRENGFVISVNPKGRSGFILSLNRKSNIFFPFSQVRQLQEADKGTHPDAIGLKSGAAVSFTLDDNPSSGKTCAVAVEILPPGTLAREVVLPGRYMGRVVRLPQLPGQLNGGAAERGRNPSLGVIQYSEGTNSMFKIDFETAQLEGGQALAENDEVEFTRCHNLMRNSFLAVELRFVSRAASRRELGQIRTLKNNFGFINCCERQEDLIFSFDELTDGVIAVGDDVEFTVAGSRPKRAAVRVKKMPKGSAQFENVLEGTLLGVVREPAGAPHTYKTGLLEYTDQDGRMQTLVFSPDDILNDTFVPSRKDVVQFQIAINPLQQKAAQTFGGQLSPHAGRRATRVTGFKIHGTLGQTKGNRQCIEYQPPPELTALRRSRARSAPTTAPSEPATPSPAPSAAAGGKSSFSVERDGLPAGDNTGVPRVTSKSKLSPLAADFTPRNSTGSLTAAPPPQPGDGHPVEEGGGAQSADQRPDIASDRVAQGISDGLQGESADEPAEGSAGALPDETATESAQTTSDSLQTRAGDSPTTSLALALGVSGEDAAESALAQGEEAQVGREPPAEWVNGGDEGHPNVSEGPCEEGPPGNVKDRDVKREDPSNVQHADEERSGASDGEGDVKRGDVSDVPGTPGPGYQLCDGNGSEDRPADLGAPGARDAAPSPAVQSDMQKMHTYFTRRELDLSAPELKQGDAVTFVLRTDNAGTDSVARFVRPLGWVPPPPPPAPMRQARGPTPPRAVPHGAAGRGYQGGAPGHPGPGYQGGDPEYQYGGGYFPAVDMYGNLYPQYGNPQAGYAGEMQGQYREWQGQPYAGGSPGQGPQPGGRGRGRGSGRQSPGPGPPNGAAHSPGGGRGGPGPHENGAQGAANRTSPAPRAGAKKGAKQRKGDAEGGAPGEGGPALEPYEVEPSEPAPRFFTGPSQQGRTKERFSRGPEDKEAKGFTGTGRVSPGDLNVPATLVQFWRRSADAAPAEAAA